MDEIWEYFGLLSAPHVPVVIGISHVFALLGEYPGRWRK